MDFDRIPACQMGHMSSQKGRRGESLTGKITRNFNIGKHFFSVLFLSTQQQQFGFISPTEKRNTQPVTARMGICSLNGQDLALS